MSEIKTLYKYRDWSNSNHKRMITKQHVWLSSASEFNDPYDCALNLTVIQSLVEHNQLDAQIKNLYGEVNEKTKAQFLKDFYEQKVFNGEMEEEKIIDDYLHNDLFKKFGVLSLTPHPDSILMWSHYSNNHKGFCIGFDFEKVKNSKSLLGDFHKVDYKPDVPEIPLWKLNSLDHENIIKMFFTKYEKWDYEDEYRCAKPKINDRLVILPKDYYTELVLGAKMPEKDQTKLLAEVKKHLPHVKIFKAKRNRKIYKMEILPLS